MSAKLPFGARRVVNASRLLNDGAVRVWLELHALDQGVDGAYIGAGPLGRRLGRSRETVERHRLQLLALGLLRKVQQAGRRTASWYCTLPDNCIPTSRTPKDAEVLVLAERLDQHLAATGAIGDATPQDEPASGLTPVGDELALGVTPLTGVGADDSEEGRVDPTTLPLPDTGAASGGASEARRAAAPAPAEAGPHTPALAGDALAGLERIAAALAPHDPRAARYLRHAAGATNPNEREFLEKTARIKRQGLAAAAANDNGTTWFPKVQDEDRGQAEVIAPEGA